MELRYYLALLRQRLLLILALVIVALGVAALATPRPAKYSADTIIYVGATNFPVSSTNAFTYDPTQLVGQLMKTYSAMLDSEPIANDALRATGAPRTAKQVVAETEVTPGTDTQLLTVTVTDRDPRVAQQLTNAVADAFMTKVRAISVVPGEGSLPSIPAYVFQRAELPDAPNGTGLIRNLALAGFFALLVGAGLVLLLDRMDLTIRSTREAESRLQLPVLGILPYNSAHAAGNKVLIVNVEQASLFTPRPANGAQPVSPTIGA